MGEEAIGSVNVVAETPIPQEDVEEEDLTPVDLTVQTEGIEGDTLEAEREATLIEADLETQEEVLIVEEESTPEILETVEISENHQM